MANHSEGSNVHTHHHHILPVRTALMVGAALLILTGITVWIAGFDFGALNTPIAMLVASIKASLVGLFFMNLLYDRRENMVIFLSAFLFLAIFGVLTATDLFFRGDVYVKGSVFKAIAGPAKFKKPWKPSEELVAHGQGIYQAQCAMCHGAEGAGNGPAGMGLDPPPRNFKEAKGWTNARTPVGTYETITKGIEGTSMPAFANLPAEDRWALTYFVLQMGPPFPAVKDSELKAIGIDPTKETVGAEAPKDPSIPIDFAIERMAEKE